MDHPPRHIVPDRLVRSLPAILATILGLWAPLTAQPTAAEVAAKDHEAVSFRNDVMAVLSKAGCNLGTCHANSSGKGGFRLSLRSYDPQADLREITRQLDGRRINLNSPEESLLLRKPLMSLPHGGGQRFTKEDRTYRILRDWIAAGAPDDRQTAPRVTRLEVSPESQILQEPDWTVRLSVHATFSDGRRRDVSDMAVYEPSYPIVDITNDGRVTARQTGEVVIGVRYLDHVRAVRLAFVPKHTDFQWNGPQPRNPIDRIVFDRLRNLGINPTAVCDDTTFLRRAFLDLTGQLPTRDEAEHFLNSDAPDKRAALVDDLLERPEFAEHWALKWSDLLRNEEKLLDRKGVQNLHAWLKVQFAQNVPLDEIARQIVSATGSTYANPAANYYRAMREPAMRAETTAQVFLGLRLGCAKCHNHPFDRWTQDDYYAWTSVFGGIDYKIFENRRRDKNDLHEFDGEQFVFLKADGRVRNPRTESSQPPRFLGDDHDVPDDFQRLDRLADWLTRPDNPFFARTQANRLWAQVVGRGIVDPIDDFRQTNPSTPPGLLEWLADDLVAHHFDLRHTLRTIMNSTVYQLASTSESDPTRERNFGEAPVRRHSAEQLFDVLTQTLGRNVPFNGYPEGTQARQIPGVQAVRVRDRSASSGDRFLTLFGKPPRLQACECERSDDSTLSQTFAFISGDLLNSQLSRSDNRIGRMLNAGRSPEEVIEALYWSALTRGPTDKEWSAIRSHLAATENRRAAIEDIAWSLINSNEFLLRR